MEFPEDVRYTREHEWARLENGVVTVGITSYATDQLGDVVFVELPQSGRQLEASKPFGVVEAVKTVSDLYAPVSGEVVEVNRALADNPALVNQSPFGEGWMIRIRPGRVEEVQQLLTHAEYARLVEEQHS
ncbi:MAG: glycine cleavage system protein GcvH [Candidatus Eisenbacteria bacterium]|uniref:Glycine cleavage system H protein n=1 Tax=Eiseniibacteriota bacterium TaxID=2212470 RepID=A0A538TGR0_UNCEI|nr:MAG: glycine cleavage system protein GcvH [Candidatus Eisenbacteria bacterium]